MRDRVPLAGLRAAMQALRAMKCPTCGKRVAVVATSWRGRGTGQSGASNYAATAFEPHDPATHCTCGASRKGTPLIPT